ncbi:MAG: metallophosphoesterase [Ruminococcus sp.]|nr:metallophosphoesterase [Ruminococcus sp.]
MRILVVSDSHGDYRSLKKAIAAQPTAEVIVHCGDGSNEVESLKIDFPEKQLIAVRGNCDWSSMLPPTEIAEVGGKRLFVTHGHLYQAKFTIYNMICAAREEKADILLYGHTHCAMNEYDDGLYIMNPGSCHGYGATYGYIDITEKGDIVTNIVTIK